MGFEVLPTPSGGILIKGRLVQRKLTAKSKRLVMLCFPKTIEDVGFLHEHMTLTNKETGQLTAEALAEATQKDMEIYGHISLSAISGFPLLVIGSTVRTFIHFSQIQGLYDEHDLGQACSFSLLTAQTEYRFFSETSSGYQKWVGALTQAFENMTNGAGNGGRLDDLRISSQSPVLSTLSRPLSVMSSNPEEYGQTGRAISMNRAASRRSMSQGRNGGAASQNGGNQGSSAANRRKSFMMGGASETMMSLHGPVQGGSEVGSTDQRPAGMGRRPSLYQRMKSSVKNFFSSTDEEDYYDHQQQQQQQMQQQPGYAGSRGRHDDEEMDDTLINRIRSRSKSVARFLGIQRSDNY